MSSSPIAGHAGAGRAWHEALADVLVHDDRYYVLASSSFAVGRRHVLKHGETFALSDRFGDIKPMGHGDEGLYHEGSRHLSTFLLRLGDDRPLFLSSTVDDNNGLLIVDLTNADLGAEGTLAVPHGSLHLMRSRFLWRGCCYDRWVLRNYGSEPIAVPLTLHFDADFVDIFEVRGARRERRGERLETEVDGDRATLGYRGLDTVKRRTELHFDPPPHELTRAHADFALRLEPGGEQVVTVAARCFSGRERAPAVARQAAFEQATAELESARGAACVVSSSNEAFDDWTKRSLADLRMLLARTDEGPYPYAGVPWFSTAFGRDGILTALECLWLWPELARGVLAHLAALQATDFDEAREAEPGKILHERRTGEMAALDELPFGRYYGTVDATPLFVVLAGAYLDRTGDLEFARELWPAVERALGWIDDHGDHDGDGFVDYCASRCGGLVQQGWKDSDDSVFHADGTLARGPIALCEVQGYVYDARRRAAELARALGDDAAAERQLRLAAELRERFEAAFWNDELGTYAIALDGDGRQCAVATSNAGHCLASGIASPERAARVAATLLDDRSFSGWGIRTVAAAQARFNPMSYHNGSIWPHDNAIIVSGFARYGLQRAAVRVFEAMFDTSRSVELQRLPELICGFDRRPGSNPTLYPVACAPQAWAAGAVFLLLEAVLGLSIDARRRQVRFERPLLPEFLERLRITGLEVAGASIDLELLRHPQAVGINVLHREGELDVVAVK